MSLPYEPLWQLRRPALSRRRLSSILRKHGFEPDGIEITEHPRSGFNRLFMFEDADGRSWLAKQNLRPPEAESWFYANLAATLTPAPTCLIADRDADVVVLEYLRGAATLEAIALEDPFRAFALLLDLAPIVAQLHTRGDSAAAVPSAQIPFPALDPIDLRFWEGSTPAARELLTHTQGRPELMKAFEKALEGSGPHGVIHGDLKLDNILLAQDRLLLVDWGCCGRGAVGWDLGALVGSMIALWADRWMLDAVSAGAGEPDLPRVTTEDVFGAARGFAGAYAEQIEKTGLAPPGPETLATYTAGWIMGRSWVEAMHSNRLAPKARVLLAVAEEITNDPAHLFGTTWW